MATVEVVVMMLVVVLMMVVVVRGMVLVVIWLVTEDTTKDGDSGNGGGGGGGGVQTVSVSTQDGIAALGKADRRCAPSLSSLPKVALETVPIFVWLNTDRSRPRRVECRPLPFSTPLSFRRSMM